MASSLGTTPIYHGGYVLAPTNSSPILCKRTYHTTKIKHSFFGGLYKGISLRAKREVPVYVCKVQTVGSSEFQEKVLNSDIPVLVDFVADWCGPCKLISPFIDWASEEYKGKLNVYKIDHDANPELVEKYKVYGLPTLILFKNGKEVSGSRREGAITKEKLKVYLDQLLGNAATL